MFVLSPLENVGWCCLFGLRSEGTSEGVCASGGNMEIEGGLGRTGEGRGCSEFVLEERKKEEKN